MKEGLLWFDNDPKRDVADKVGRAAARYQTKFGCQPTICYLSQRDFKGEFERVNGIRLQSAANVRPNYFLVGVEQETLARTA